MFQGAARLLYGHVDNLELYTGLQAESLMPLTDGSRFNCGFTVRLPFLLSKYRITDSNWHSR